MSLRLSEEGLAALLANRGQKQAVSRVVTPKAIQPQESLYEILAYGQLKCANSPCVIALRSGLKAICNPATKRKPFEMVEQAATLVWLEYTFPEAFEMTTTNPMGGYRPDGAGGQIRGEGAKKGYPDILTDMPQFGYHGLRIEMKQNCQTAEPTSEQLLWLTRLSRNGYKAVLCRGHQGAIFTYCDYFNITKPKFNVPVWAIVYY